MRTLFKGGNVFDGVAEPGTADIVVEDGRIVDVGPGLDGDVAVDVSGRAVLPGLIDCHVHVVIDHVDMLRHLQTPYSYTYFKIARNLEAILKVGVTTIRDAGGADLGIKQAVEHGLVNGPRMQVAITLISQTGGHSDSWMVSGCSLSMLGANPGVPEAIVDGPEEMRRKVRELVRAGADWIKLASSGGVMSPRDDPKHAHFRDDELQMAVSEAAAADLYVMAHAQANEGIKNAVRNGVRSIEHGIYLDEEAIGLMLEHGTYFVPTLTAPMSIIDAAESGQGFSEASKQKVHMVFETHRESFRKAQEAGVKICMGTDTVGWPHGRNLEELQVMAELGMPPIEVLRSTTSVAAELLRVSDELGSIAPGKRADLVVLDGDPLDVSKMTDRVVAVFKDGSLVVGEGSFGE